MSRRLTAISVIGLLLQPGLALSQEAITVAEAYSLARDNDPRVQIAGFQRDAVAAREDQSTALFFPQVRVFSQYSKNEVEYENALVESRRYDGRRYGASVSQKLFDWGALS